MFTTNSSNEKICDACKKLCDVYTPREVYEPRKIQVWACTDNTVPLSLGVFEDITEFSIDVGIFTKDVRITFEDYCE